MCRVATRRSGVHRVAALYADSAPAVYDVQTVARADGVDDEAAQHVFVALKLRAPLGHRHGPDALFQSARRPVAGVYARPVAHAVSEAPHELVDDLHEPHVVFEERCLADVEAPYHLGRVRDVNVAPQEPADELARESKVHINVALPRAEQGRLWVRADAFFDV